MTTSPDYPKNSQMTTDLREEVQARKESHVWNLNNCPCCGGKPQILELRGYKIACGKYGCREVEALTLFDAAHLWNQPDFRQAQRRD